MTRQLNGRTSGGRSPKEPAGGGFPENQMRNTHLLAHRFEYVRPGSIEEAVAALAVAGENACVLAGGTNLVVDIKTESIAPETIIDISGLPGLRGIEERRDGVHIGALTSIQRLARSGLLWTKPPPCRSGSGRRRFCWRRWPSL